MRAIVADKLGAFDKILRMDENHPIPKIKKDTELLIKVAACSLSPGDFRRVRGDIDAVWNPKPPFIVGMNVCGIVEECGPNAKFKVGDCVVGSDDTFLGGLAEYKVLDSSLVQIKPSTLSRVEAATTPDSALRALKAIEYVGIRGNERVLVIGGSGGFSSFLLQFLKLTNIPYLAVVSSEEEMMRSLGADKVFNHKIGENYWECEEYLKNKFDVVFDCVGGNEEWQRVRNAKILKPGSEGGFFLAVAPFDPVMQVHRPLDLTGFMCGLMTRTTRSMFFRWTSPKYRQFLIDGKSSSCDLTRLFDYFEEGKLKVILDPPEPFAFTVEDAVAAFRLQESRQAHGKIVIQITNE